MRAVNDVMITPCQHRHIQNNNIQSHQSIKRIHTVNILYIYPHLSVMKMCSVCYDGTIQQQVVVESECK